MSRKPETRKARPRRRPEHRSVERNSPHRDHARLMSSHPEIEEEIVAVGCDVDETRLNVEENLPPAKPIVSIDGCDVEPTADRKNDRAA